MTNDSSHAVGSPPSVPSLEARAWGGGTLLAVLLFLFSGWGCLNIYHATMHAGLPFHFVGRQLAWLCLGMGVLAASASVPFSTWRRWLPTLALGALLFLVLVLAVGVRRNGMKGWFEVGPFLLQPAEFAKPVFVLWLCWMAEKIRDGGWLRLTAMAGAWIVFLMLQPDFGMVMVYVIALGVTLVLSGIRWRHLALGPVLLAPLVAVAVFRHSYVADRIIGFLDPTADPFGKGWHLLQCQYALARGGLWGTGWGGALWAHAYLPLAHSDSAYAAMAEALGWTGCLPVVILFPLLAYTGCRLAAKSADPVARLYVQAFSLTIAAQGLLHLSVNTGLFPVTGVTLPFFSYGGSSLLSLMFGFGILISAAAAGESATAGEGTESAATPGMTQPPEGHDVS